MSVRQDDNRRSWRVLQAALVLIVSIDERRLPSRWRRRILRWMQRSPENLIHLFEIARVDRALDRLKLLKRRAQLERTAEVTPTSWGPLVTRRAAWMGGTAVVALFLGISIVTIGGRSPAVRHVPLEDGSVMHVLRGSDFDVEFNDRHRLVTLPLGEAVFEVAKDPRRPFIVRSKLSDSIAVGTRFGVVTNSAVTTTTVSEGEVRVVTPVNADPATGTAVHAGEELRVVAGTSQAGSVRTVNAKRRLSWSAGWLEFDGETIGEAVRTFNRYNDVRIEIAPELSTARLTYHRFTLDKPESFALAIASALKAPVRRDPARSVLYIGDGQPKPE